MLYAEWAANFDFLTSLPYTDLNIYEEFDENLKGKSEYLTNE